MCIAKMGEYSRPLLSIHLPQDKDSGLVIGSKRVSVSGIQDPDSNAYHGEILLTNKSCLVDNGSIGYGG